MAYIDAYLEEASHRAMYGKTPCRAPALKVLILEFLIARVEKLTPEYHKLMDLYAKYNIGLAGPGEVSCNEMSIVPPLGGVDNCGGSTTTPPVVPLTDIYTGYIPGPPVNTTEPTQPTEAEILAGALVKLDVRTKLSIPMKSEVATSTGVGWIAVDSTTYTGPFVEWYESPLNEGAIDDPFVGGAVSNFIFKSGVVVVNGLDFDVFMFSYQTDLDGVLELLK